VADTPIRILCVDDHAIVRDGITFIINRQPDLEVVGSTGTAEEAVLMCRDLKPDVTLMDLQLPGMSGLEAIRLIRRDNPAARVIVLTMYRGDEDIHRALQAGAATYLLKDTLSDHLIRVIREVHAGQQAVEPHVREQLAARAVQATLTSREVEVLELIAKAMRTKEIATSLGISEQTARVHVKNILAKFEVSDRIAAVNIARSRGWIHLL
jgi:two-component system NarL family response regulator